MASTGAREVLGGVPNVAKRVKLHRIDPKARNEYSLCENDAKGAGARDASSWSDDVVDGLASEFRVRKQCQGVERISSSAIAVAAGK